MPFAVWNLIAGRGEPVTVQSTDSVQRALELMMEHDYSQLPAVDETRCPVGMVTYESILRALSNFGVCLENLRVSSAVVKAQTFGREDDLFDVLDRLKETNAVLIVDRSGGLIDIITSYDSTEYFRQRAEDSMLVEDIETMIKDLIQAVFNDEEGEVDQEQLADAIEQITDSNKQLQARYQNALRRYLRLVGQEEAKMNPGHVQGSFSHLATKRKPKAFDDLTLYEYTEMLLHRSRWHLYHSFLDVEPDGIRRLLEGVRETRNTLAHFRGEITSKQRDQLRFCVNWLARHSAKQLTEHLVGIPVEWPLSGGRTRPAAVREKGTDYETHPGEEHDVVPTEEELSPDDSRYAPLALWLQNRPSNVDRVQLSFVEVEEIIGGELPPSAHSHRSWWANDSVGHVQSKQWLEVGWRVAQLSISEKRATFARIREREKAYIGFFSALQTDLRQAATFSIKEMSPGGWSYQTIASLPEGGPQCLHFVFAFARGNRFRVELYIDAWDRDKSKGIFDSLQAQRDRIQEELSDNLSWERLSEKQASRIAWYHFGSITDDERSLTALRTWAVDAMIRFYNALAQPASEALVALEDTAG